MGAHLCEADVEATTVKTEEKTLRERPDELARWILLLEAIDVEAAESACRDLLGAGGLTEHGAAGVESRGRAVRRCGIN